MAMPMVGWSAGDMISMRRSMESPGPRATKNGICNIDRVDERWIEWSVMYRTGYSVKYGTLEELAVEMM